MANAELLAIRGRGERRPPERFHVFVSYTTREDEVREVKPIVDHFLNGVLRPVIEKTLGEPPAFYDGYSLYHPGRTPGYIGPPRRLPLEATLRFAIEESEVLVGFMSAEYVASEWCVFECRTMATKQLRPWFDLCRKAPIRELRDKRPPNRRPSRLECALARLRMRMWRRRNEPAEPGGEIVAIWWKGDQVPIERLPGHAQHVSDWRPCLRAAEMQQRILHHLWRHGSVSPVWEREAEAAQHACLGEMETVAARVVQILQRRRESYKRWQP